MAAGVTGVNNSTNNASSIGTGLSGMLNPADFLKLLITQMQNQDPTSPSATDTGQQLQELASITNTQYLSALNTNFSNYSHAQDTINSAALIGATVTTVDSKGNKYSGQVTQVDFDPTTGTTSVILNGQKPFPISEITSVSPTIQSSTTGQQ